MKLTCIIVTKDRPQELRRCLASLRKQTRQPDQIIVVEGGDSRLAAADITDLEYHTSAPGITRQRNLARSLVAPDCDIVVYLDDDVVVQSDVLARVVTIFSEHQDIVGLTGRIDEGFKPSWLKRLFGALTLMYTLQPFSLTRGLFNIVQPPQRAQAVAWLPGAFMCYRWSAIKDLAFDEWFADYGLGEDLDFSLRAVKLGTLLADPALLVQHDHSATSRDWAKFGYMRIVNRNYIRRKYFVGRFDYWLGMWWANGWIVKVNAVRAMYSQRYRAEFIGEIKGILKLLRRRA